MSTMSKNRSICRRCHRLRPVDNTRCCAGCAEELRAIERPKRRAPVAGDTADLAQSGSELQADPPEPQRGTLTA
jgi:predicted amidophosphoribosyltransferase